MRGGGALGDGQSRGNLPIREALRYQRGHLPLAARQQATAGTRPAHRLSEGRGSQWCHRAGVGRRRRRRYDRRRTSWRQIGNRRAPPLRNRDGRSRAGAPAGRRWQSVVIDQTRSGGCRGRGTSPARDGHARPASAAPRARVRTQPRGGRPMRTVDCAARPGWTRLLDQRTCAPAARAHALRRASRRHSLQMEHPEWRSHPVPVRQDGKIQRLDDVRGRWPA